MDCNFEPYNDKYKCIKCGFISPILGRHYCYATTTSETLSITENEQPSLGMVIWNFTKATAKHLILGAPKRTQTEVTELYKICQECELFRENRCTHTSCGCNINDKLILLNKLYWATEHCPINKW